MPQDSIPDKPFVNVKQKWECGCDGEPCRHGPDKRGRCQMLPECQPAREGERWLCARPLSRGGACEKGPLPNGECCKKPTPCLPRLSPEAMLTRAWLMTALFFTGLSLVFLSYPALMAPGKLMPPHTPMDAQCERCHGGFDDSPAMMAAQILFGGAKPNHFKCADCHRLGEFGTRPHSVAKLRAVAGAREVPLEMELSLPFFNEELMQEITCTNCHRSHDGERELIPSMSDLQCQVCHASAWRSIVTHPQWRTFPHHDESSIGYAHDVHFRLHFKEAAKDGITPPDKCSDCHRGEENGNMLLRGFAACAGCHEDQITADNAHFVVLAPPGMDLETMETRNIGEWPEYAEAEPNAFLLLMLKEGGYMTAAELKTLGGLDLFDLTEANEDETNAAVKLARAFKQLMFDLQTHGPEVLVRAARQSGAAPDNAAQVALAASMPPGVVDAAVNAWFPNLANEMAQLANGAQVETSFTDIATEQRENLEKWSAFGGWQLGDLELIYRPTGHADRFLHGWMSFADSPSPQAQALFDSLTKDAAPGKCAKCHVADRGRARVLNWVGRGSAPDETAHNRRSVAAFVERGVRREVKDFSHFSHMQAIERNGCVLCHQVAEDANRTNSGFVRVPVAKCIECHNEATDLDSCTTCHNYHFPLFEDSLLHEGGLISQPLPETKGEQVSTSLAR